MHPDCLDPRGAADIVAACIQAAATVEAGRMQAAAASRAGSMSLIAGLIAAAGVLFAASLAYESAMASVSIARDQRKARIEGYRFQIIAVLDRITASILGIHAGSIQQHQDWREVGGSYGINLRTIPAPEELDPKDWENHALLGTEFVLAVHKFHNAYIEMRRFIAEMRDGKVDDYSSYPTLIQIAHNNGGVTYEPEPAVAQYERLCAILVDGVQDLRKCVGLKYGADNSETPIDGGPAAEH